MHYYPDEPSSSQFVPEDEEYAQRAAMDEDDRKLAKLNSRVSSLSNAVACITDHL